MTDDIRAELEGIYTTVRRAFAEYDLQAARPYVEIPPGMPLPTRPESIQIADFMPDLARSRFLEVRAEGDFAGYYADTSPQGESGAEITVIRFRRGETGWRLLAGQSMSSYGSDEIGPDDLPGLIDSEPSLALVPEDLAVPEPPPPMDLPAGEERPDSEVRPELEHAWNSIREAFAAGDPEAARPHLFFEAEEQLPSPEEAPGIVDQLPDLSASRFVKLGWRADKPHLAGYYAAVDGPGDDESTLWLLVFVRPDPDGPWMFAPGPGQMQSESIPRMETDAIVRLIEDTPSLQL